MYYRVKNQIEIGSSGGGVAVVIEAGGSVLPTTDRLTHGHA